MSTLTKQYDNMTFHKTNILAKGYTARVYNINNNNDYVVKKIHNHFVHFMMSFGVMFCSPRRAFKKEVKTTILLSADNIAPKIIYYNYKKKYYVTEKMDYTLKDMIIDCMMTNEHKQKLKSLMNRLNNTKYRHLDLHNKNIMWSNKLNDFQS